MKIGFYDDYRPCLVKENGVVDISDEVRNLPSGSPQLLLENIILNWDSLRPRLQDKWSSAPVTASLQQARLRAPVPTTPQPRADEKRVRRAAAIR